MRRFIAAQLSSKFRLCISNVLLLMGLRAGRRTWVRVYDVWDIVIVSIAFPVAGCLKPRWVVVGFRIVHYIRIGINTCLHSQRIALPVFAGSWVVISMVVLMQSRLSVEHLASKPYVVGNSLALYRTRGVRFNFLNERFNLLGTSTGTLRRNAHCALLSVAGHAIVHRSGLQCLL